MQININVKGVSRKKAAVIQITREYPDRAMTVEDFIAETVRQCVREYNDNKEENAVMLRYLQDIEEAESALADKAVTGKVAYGEMMDERRADPAKAVANALQCFDDGMVALFADGTRYQQRDEEMALRDQSEVTFVRLTFLAGRMW